jgi:hypothetical protein
MAPTAEFAPQALALMVAGIVCFVIAIRTLRSDPHHYTTVRRKTGGARRAAVGTVGHQAPDDADAMTVHGMAVTHRNGRRIIVRNGKIAEDSLAGC